jgi:hypothetical protein
MSRDSPALAYSVALLHLLEPRYAQENDLIL